MYGGLPITVVPCAAISRKRDVPEVGDLQNAVLRHQHVARPQVAVQDAGAVRVIDRIADLTAEVERARQLERAVAHDDVLERIARARTPSR
jgi:hypothetical protein